MEWDMTIKPLYMLIVVLGCQGGDLTLPADGSPGQLRAISGYDQQGHVNSVLPELLVVQVVDGAGRPVPNAALRFQTDEPAARLVPPEVPTNENGYAAAQVHLGSREGTQTFEAFLADAGGSDLRSTFTLVALAKPPVDDSGEDDDESDDGGRGGNGNRDQKDDHKRDRDKDQGRGHGDDNGRGQGGHGDHDRDDD
jgi:hypothetical protein